MGKTTGFLDYERAERPVVSPAERVKNFDDFHGMLSEEQRREQCGRCMNCGVPFCQSDYGCPLHNLIPEWNDDIWNGNRSHAVHRLLKTNNFPEFTGRVCPALCETACVCGLDGESVSVHDNELQLIEYAYASGMMQPRIPQVRSEKRVAVVGSGPAGLAAADQLNQRGHNVTVYEKNELPGGLLMFGIPNMKLDKSVILRRTELMKAEGVQFVCGTEIGKDIAFDELLMQYDAVILCCGAEKCRGIDAANRDVSGVYQAVEYLSEATRGVLSGAESGCTAKGKHVVIVGNGDTATDCLATAIRQQAASVLQLVRKPAPEKQPVVWPGGRDLTKIDYGHEEALAVYGADPRLYESTVSELLTDENGALSGVVINTAGQVRTVEAQMLLIAAGFTGMKDELIAAAGLQDNGRGSVIPGSGRCTTENEKIFIAGDARTGASLVVRAIADGRACARTVDEYLEGYTNM